MEQCLLIIRIFRVGQLGEITDFETESGFILGSRIHVVSEQENQFQDLGELLAVSHFLTSRCSRHNVRLDILHHVRVGQLKVQIMKTRRQTFDFT